MGRAQEIWLFRKAWAVGWLERLCKCAKCGWQRNFKKCEAGGNRNSVILSRMIKARVSSFVCPVAPYVSYFSFTSFQGSGSFFA